MGTLFLGGTALKDLEMQMQQPPNYKPRGRGFIAVENTVHTDLSIEEIIHIFVKELHINALQKRLQSAINKKEGQKLYLNPRHKKRILSYLKKRTSIPSDSYLAAVYLLSSDDFLWNKVIDKKALDETEIYFNKIKISGVHADGYTIYCMAKDLYYGTNHVRLNELADPQVVSDSLLCLIIKSFMIRRYGIQIIKAA